MAKKSKKYETEEVSETSLTADELDTSDTPSDTPSEPKPPRAPRIVHPRFSLIDDATGDEIKFTHYALPTRRAPAGKVLIDQAEVEFTVTKSKSRDKLEDRAYSYFTLPNGATGYVSVELEVGQTLKLVEKAPAAPFGREPKAATEGGSASTLPRAEMPVEA